MGAPVLLDGLSAQEAARRLAADGPNELPTAKRRNLLQEARDVVRQPMLLLLLGAGAVNFALAALRDLSSPRALVIRDGQQVRIAGRDVVRGDVILPAEGDRVPTDAILLEGNNFSVDESALTGESVPVRKVAGSGEQLSADMGQPGGDATPWVFSGTLAVKGHAIAVAKETGAGTELGKIGATLPHDRRRTHPADPMDKAFRTVPALRHAFNFGPLPALGWLVAVVAGVAGVVWFEIYTAVAARRPTGKVES
ncbi:P-type ATPase [Mycolicibacterium sp. CBM1]